MIILTTNDMVKMKLYSLDEVTDKYIGKTGTAERNEFDAELDNFFFGEAVKKARIEQNMTQEELGAKIGIGKAQISKIENGRNTTIATLSRIFRAMGIKATIDMGSYGRVAL